MQHLRGGLAPPWIFPLSVTLFDFHTHCFQLVCGTTLAWLALALSSFSALSPFLPWFPTMPCSPFIPWIPRGPLFPAAPYNNLYGEVLPNRVHLSIQDRLFHVLFFLSTFGIEKLSSWHHWKKKALKLVKFPSFESDLLKSDEDISPQSRAKFYRSRPFVWLVPDTKSIEIEFTYIQSC